MLMMVYIIIKTSTYREPSLQNFMATKMCQNPTDNGCNFTSKLPQLLINK